MATRNYVPRASGEGSIGTKKKHWGAIFAEKVAVKTLEVIDGGTENDAQPATVGWVKQMVMRNLNGFPLIHERISSEWIDTVANTAVSRTLTFQEEAKNSIVGVHIWSSKSKYGFDYKKIFAVSMSSEYWGGKATILNEHNNSNSYALNDWSVTVTFTGRKINLVITGTPNYSATGEGSLKLDAYMLGL